MRIEYLVISQSSSIDAERNAISLFEIIEEVAVTKISEDSSINVCVAFALLREDEVGYFSVKTELLLTTPNSRETLMGEALIAFNEIHKRSRGRLFINIKIPQPGRYTVRVNVPEKNCDSQYSFDVSSL